MKKLLLILGILWFALSLNACILQKPYTLDDVISSVDIVYAEGDQRESVTKNVTLSRESTLSKEATILWVSNNPSVLDGFGTVNRQAEDVEVVLTVTVTFNGESLSRIISVIVKGTNATADVTINIYIEALDSETYVLTETKVIKAQIGIMYDGIEQLTGLIVNTEQSVSSGIVSESTPLELSIYYDRIEYTVQFYRQGELILTTIVKYQATVDQPEDPIYEDFPFLGWATIQNGSIYFDFTSPITGSTTLYAVFEGIQGTYTGYYEGADGLTGTTLKDFLRNLVTTGYIGVSYGDARYLMGYTDRDLLMTQMVRNIYDGARVSYVWDSGASWNREHVWPQSRMGVEVSNSSINIGSDIHNLRAATPSVNSSRGNKNFDWTTTASSYYPGDADRGDVARILFYMVIRYSQLQLVNGNPIDDGTLWIGNLSALLEWHVLDPVDDFERQRNERIFTGASIAIDTSSNKFLRQNNRNPFIDHPEFVELIWGTTTTHAAPQERALWTAPFEPMFEVIEIIMYEVDLASFKRDYNQFLKGGSHEVQTVW